MSLNENIIESSLDDSNWSYRVRTYLDTHPEWWVWLFCGFVWFLLILNSFIAVGGDEGVSRLISCLPIDALGDSDPSTAILKQPSVFESIRTRLLQSVFPWIVMIIAMMLPLLRRAIRHASRSVLPPNREASVLLFLFSYTLVWTAAGLLFLLLPVVMDFVFGLNSVMSNGVAAGVVFILAALISWLPSRKVVMVRCEHTRPIQTSGWNLVKDSITYGFVIGLACLRMCWVVMAALMLAHHGIFLMLLVTLVALIERYRVPHESQIPGYAWTIIGVALIFTGLLF